MRAAAIAAIYTLLTVFLAPLSSGLVQCRVAEALCVLPYFTGAAVPGLFIGCALSNALTGAPLPDVLFGSLATLLGALGTLCVRKLGWPRPLAPLPPVLCNGLVVGALLVYAYGVGVSYPLAAAYVAAGELAACYGLGLPLLLVLERYGGGLFR